MARALRARGIHTHTHAHTERERERSGVHIDLQELLVVPPGLLQLGVHCHQCIDARIFGFGRQRPGLVLEVGQLRGTSELLGAPLGSLLLDSEGLTLCLVHLRSQGHERSIPGSSQKSTALCAGTVAWGEGKGAGGGMVGL